MFRIIPINKWMVVGFILMVVGFLLLTVLIGIVIMPVGVVILVFGMHKAICAEGRRVELALIRKIPDAKTRQSAGFRVVRPRRFERLTSSFAGRRSIQAELRPHFTYHGTWSRE